MSGIILTYGLWVSSIESRCVTCRWYRLAASILSREQRRSSGSADSAEAVLGTRRLCASQVRH